MKDLGVIHHIAIKVKDLKLVADFYQEVLGLKQIETKLDKNGHPRSHWFDCGGTILMIEQEKSVTRSNGNLIALKIKRAKRDLWKKHLQKYNIEITSESEHSVYFSDPEGNLLALSHFPE